jgi:hypothetical protein
VVGDNQTPSSNPNLTSRSATRIVLTDHNINSTEINRRIKFDLELRTRVLNYKAGGVTNKNLRNLIIWAISMQAKM